MAESPSTAGTAVKKSDLGTTAAYWAAELQQYRKLSNNWRKQAKRAVRRYKLEEVNATTVGGSANASDDPTLTTRFNVLYSNVQTMLPALFSTEPMPVVERRHKDPDPIARLSATVLERAVKTEMEKDRFEDLGERMVLDLLLVGRGVLWSRYEPTIQRDRSEVTIDKQSGRATRMSDGEEMDMQGETFERDDEDGKDYHVTEELTAERTPIDYVHWDDFAHQASAKTWADLLRNGWVARRVMMTRQQGLKRFGDIFMQVPLSHTPEDSDDSIDDTHRVLQSAEVWEVWDASKREVVWFSPGYLDKVLDRKKDPLGLEMFFPCVVALGAKSNEDLLPTPDYEQYRTLADELDEITDRISILVDALRVRGYYDNSAEGIGTLLSGSGPDLQMVGVEGVNGRNIREIVDWLPIDTMANVLNQLYASREQTKQTLFEVSGVSDIVRGQVDPREKLGQSQIKGQFASQRLDKRRNSVAMAMRDILRLKSEIMVEHYQADTLRELSGYDFLNEVVKQQQMSQMQLGVTEQWWQQIVQLLESEKMRGYRVDIETDSTVALTTQQTQQDRAAMIEAVGTYMERSLVMATNVPQMVPLITEILQFAMRGFKIGRNLERTFEETMQTLTDEAQRQQQAAQQQQQGPSPEQQEAQAKQQEAALKAQQQQQEAEAKAMERQQEAEFKAAEMQGKQAMQAADLQMKQQELQLKERSANIDLMKAERMAQIEIQKAELGLEQQRQAAMIPPAPRAPVQ